MENEIRLTKLAECAGCAAKMGAGTLSRLLQGFQSKPDPRLLVGYDRSDDACVYDLGNNSLLIQTVDYFPPPVDDPYLYGQIAAANALSDIYAMGGRPRLALNILCTPESMAPDTIREILRGGYDKVQEAGAVIAGGHSIHGPQPLYGLCITGFGEKSRLWKNAGAQPGDALLLTKALGVGLISTAARAELCSERLLEQVYGQMSCLNRAAAELAADFEIHACTDVTGFGLIGHSIEMAQGSGCTLHIRTDKLPHFPEAVEFAAMGFVPAGAYRNRDFARGHVQLLGNISRAMTDLLYDPQTSGGLLFALPRAQAPELLARLRESCPAAAIIGYAGRQEETALVIE